MIHSLKDPAIDPGHVRETKMPTPLDYECVGLEKKLIWVHIVNSIGVWQWQAHDFHLSGAHDGQLK